jgi:hypothetical protein
MRHVTGAVSAVVLLMSSLSLGGRPRTSQR